MTTKQLILNRYRPMLEAGTGGFATVQVAWDTQMQRKVAIKCIELTRAASDPSSDEAANEVSAPLDDRASAGGSPSRNRSDRAHVEDLRSGASSVPTRVVRPEEPEIQGRTRCGLSSCRRCWRLEQRRVRRHFWPGQL